MRQKNPQKIVDDFNRTYPVGTKTYYRGSPGATPVEVTVTEEAFVLGGHTACTMVDGVRGAVAVDALGPIRP